MALQHKVLGGLDRIKGYYLVVTGTVTVRLIT